MTASESCSSGSEWTFVMASMRSSSRMGAVLPVGFVMRQL